MNNYQKRVQKAVLAFEKRKAQEEARTQKPKKKNKSPERDLQKIILAHLNTHRWVVYSIEAKAVYSKSAGRYLNSQTTPGLADVVGSTPNGESCFLELKAPGRRSKLEDHQRAHLIKAIKSNAFAGCFDSLENILQTYSQWSDLKSLHSLEAAKTFLLNHLP